MKRQARLSIQLLRSVIAYALIPNLFFAIADAFFYMMRPKINVDYLGLAVLAPFLPTPLNLGLFFLIFANDLVVNIAPIFHFEVADVASMIKDVPYLSASFAVPRFVILLGACCVVSALAIKCAGKVERRRAVSAAMFALAFSVCLSDVLNGTAFVHLTENNQAIVDFNIANSGVRKSVLSLLTLRNGDRLVATPLKPDESATGILLSDFRRESGEAGYPDRLAIVIVESMGWFDSASMREELFSMFRSPELASRYRVKVGSVPFSGSTMHGEFRELCGLRLGVYGDDLPKCLPQRLHELGYDTVAMHNFTKVFYNRYHWYPRVGFARPLFAEELHELGYQRTCGASFTGICDTDVARAFRSELLASPDHRKLTYWMTLNSHLPIDSDSAQDSTYDCSRNTATREANICIHTQIIHRALSSLAKIAADPELPPTRFVIVGDHAPPFLKDFRRNVYAQDRVPYLLLEPLPPAPSRLTRNRNPRELERPAS